MKNEIIEAGKRIDQRGWAPATGGNYSHRIDHESLWVTVSGVHKGQLTANDIMRYSISGEPLEDRKPSAEAFLHAVIYELYPSMSAALHTHSVSSTVLSKLTKGDTLEITDYEMLKIFPNVTTHEHTVKIPIFDNTQNMRMLASEMRGRLAMKDYAFIIRGHGLYGWGKTMKQALQVIEGCEFLFECELNMLRFGKS